MRSARVSIGGKNFHASPAGDITSAQGLYGHGRLFRLSEEPNSEVKGCLVLFISVTTASIWKNNGVSLAEEQLDNLYLLLLPHIKIDIDPEKIFQMYTSCFTIVVDSRDDATYDNETVVRGGENPELLVKRLIYKGEFNNQEIRKLVLQYLFDYYWNESHDTKVLRSTLIQTLYIPQSLLDPNVHFLIQKGFIDPFYDTSKQLISVSIIQKGIEYVENGFQGSASSVQIIQNMGDQINTTINGNNNTVNIKGELNQLFLSIETEIESKNEPNKKEVLAQVAELKTEMEGPKNFDKIQTILSKLKDSASWVHEKIVKHPVVAQVIAQAVANQIGIAS